MRQKQPNIFFNNFKIEIHICNIMCINKFIATTKTKINNFTYVLSFDSDFNISLLQKNLIKNLKIKMPNVKMECTGTAITNIT